MNKKTNPIELLEFLIENHGLTLSDIASILNKDESLINQILSYKRFLSSEDISNLANRFKMQKEAFSQPYQLKT